MASDHTKLLTCFYRAHLFYKDLNKYIYIYIPPQKKYFAVLFCLWYFFAFTFTLLTFFLTYKNIFWTLHFANMIQMVL